MGTVAVVTGAASGVGAAVTQRLVDSDFQVWAADLVAPPQLVDPAADVHYVPIDVSSSVHVASFFEKLSSENSTPRVVVHAAGVDDPVAKAQVADATESSQPITVTAAMADEQWRRTISINLDGTFHILRAAVRSMWETGGAIVVIGSSAAFDCPVGYPHYSASKAGVHALCQSVAKEVIGRGIRVNVVAPGPTQTAMSSRTPATAQRDMVNGHVPLRSPTTSPTAFSTSRRTLRETSQARRCFPTVADSHDDLPQHRRRHLERAKEVENGDNTTCLVHRDGRRHRGRHGADRGRE